MMDLRDKLWIWGLTPGRDNQGLGIDSRMTPAEAAKYIGARNVYMVVNFNKPEPPFDPYSKALTTFKEVKWSIIGDMSSTRTDEPFGDLEEVLRQADRYPNVTGGVLDDFFCHPTRAKNYTPDKIAYIREQMHNHKNNMDLWCVYYPTNDNSAEHLANVDGAHMWMWKECDMPDFGRRYKKFLEMTEGKKRQLGIYFINYGEDGCRTWSIEHTKRQLEHHTEALVKGEIDGIILCANSAMDVGFPCVEFARKWIEDNYKF